MQNKRYGQSISFCHFSIGLFCPSYFCAAVFYIFGSNLPMSYSFFPVKYTVFTVAITFYAGLAPGLIVAALYNPVMTFIYAVIYGIEIFYFACLYAVGHVHPPIV